MKFSCYFVAGGIVLGKIHPFRGKGNTRWMSSVTFCARSRFCEVQVSIFVTGLWQAQYAQSLGKFKCYFLWQVHHLVNRLNAKYIGENRNIFQYKMFLALTVSWSDHSRIMLGSASHWGWALPFFQNFSVSFLVTTTIQCQTVLLQCYSMLESATSIPIVTCQTSFLMRGFDFLGPTSSNFKQSSDKMGRCSERTGAG